MDEPLRPAPAPGKLTPPAGAPPFVNREDELRLLDVCLEEAIGGRAQVVLLRGDAGIGKTRLLRELRALAEGRGVRVCYGRCHESLTLPYLPFVESLLAQLSKLPVLPDSALAADLRVIDAFLHGDSVAASAADRPATAGSDQDRLRVFLAIARATIALAQAGPLLFIVDDLHWADQSSLDLFSHLAFSLADAARREPVPLLIVGSYRSVEAAHPLGRAVARFNREAICRSLELVGLGEGETDALLTGLGLPRPPRLMVSTITRATAGNPLFIQEVVHQLQRLGVVDAAGAYRTQGISAADLRLPGEVTEAIRERIRGLGAPLVEMLTLASVLGESFTLPLLSAVAAQAEEDVLALLEEAIRLRVFVSEGEQFQFVHPLIRHVLYSAPSAPRRRRLHLRVAEALERLRDADADAYVLEIAHHLIEAGPSAEWARVIACGRRAGERAAALYAWNDAARYYDATIAAAEAAPGFSTRELADLYYAAAFAHFRDTDLGPSLRLYERAIRDYRDVDDPRGLALALADRTRLLISSGAVGVGELVDPAPLEEVLAWLGEAEPALCGRVLVQIAEICFMNLQQQRALEAAQRAVEIAERIGDDALSVQTHFMLGLARWQGLQLDAALESYRRSRASGMRSGDLWNQVGPAARIPHVLLELGQVEEVTAAAAEAIELCRKTSDWAEYSFALAAVEAAAIARGDLAAAERYAQQVMRLVYRTRFWASGAMALPALASGRAGRGLWTEAEDAVGLYAEPGRLFDEISPEQEGSAWTYRRLIRAHAGDVAAVRTELAANPALVRAEGPADLFSVERFCALVEIADCLQDPVLAARPYAALCAAADAGVLLTCGWLFLVPRVLGLAAALNHNWGEAERHFDRALDVATRAAINPELGRVWLDYARMLAARAARGDRERAVQLLRQAIPVLHGMEMEPFARQAHSLAVTLHAEIPRPRPSIGTRPDGLSEYEARLLAELARGRTDRQIADDLLLRPATVAAYAADFCARTGATRETLPAYIRDTAALAPLPVAPEPELPVGPKVSTPVAPYPFGLSAREVEVLRLMAVGKRDRDIAEALVISRNTVIRHVSNILDKTACANRTEAAAQAYRHHLMD